MVYSFSMGSFKSLLFWLLRFLKGFFFLNHWSLCFCFGFLWSLIIFVMFGLSYFSVHQLFSNPPSVLSVLTFSIFFMSIKTWFVTLLNLVFLSHFWKWLFLLFWIVHRSQLLGVWVPIILIYVNIFLFLCHFLASLVPIESTLPVCVPLYLCFTVLPVGFHSSFSCGIWIPLLSLFLAL